ncbi:MAG: cytochrome c biogenesis protein CcsA [Deltaproteobacteria bacterium]|nr:cytochrome c biogenesis protein CcsA [Deltaproteobacteria bacterium]
MPNFHTTAAAFNVLAIAAVTKGRVLVAGFPLYRSAELGGRFVRTPIPDTDPVKFLTMELPGLGAMTLVALVAFALATVFGVLAGKSDSSIARRRSFGGLAFATILLTFVLGHMIARSGAAPNYNLAANGYGFALLAAGWIFAVLTITLEMAGDRLRERLPATKVLDNLTYKSIVVAFPILTFMLLSGAIWANQAWGRFWGWDPKETAALATWFVYLIYLHTRITRGWKGRKTAYIAVLGFASVLFTYLGVNLVISGLHSYATG